MKAIGSTPARDAAVEWLRDQARIDSDVLAAVLDAIRGSAAEVGTNLAVDAIPGATVPAGATVVTDWSAWAPGNARAAGYADLLGVRLEALDVLIDGITGTTLDTLGMMIGDGIAAGDPMAVVAGSIDSLFADPARSMMIARTETCRAVEAASQATYADAGVAQWEWLVGAGCCDECELIDGDVFDVDGGMDPPPLHPNCRCTSLPIVDTSAPDDAQVVEGDG